MHINNYGRIDRVAFKATISVSFTIATLSAICRIAVRLWYQKRIFVDDYILLFGCSAMIAAFILINTFFEDIYFYLFLTLGPVGQVFQESQSAGFADRVARFQQWSFTVEIMCWVTVFAVKISYLMFFRQILNRLQAQMIYWKTITGVVVIAGIFCVCCIFIICPHFFYHGHFCDHEDTFMKSIIISQIANSLDMITDLLIVSIPINLLRKANIRLQQKAILGTFLCLSICMFAITLVRSIRQTIHSTTKAFIDVQWDMFWHMIEACVAVIVVSLTSFRSLYGIKKLQQEQKNKKRYEPWLSKHRWTLLWRRKQHDLDEFGNLVSNQSHALPSIPGGTLTGMRTMIGNLRKSTNGPMRSDNLLSTDEAQNQGDSEEPAAVKVVDSLDTRESVKNSV